MLKAVHFGAGNIGRGFIGYLLYKSGYEITFVDISKELVESINNYKRYNVIILKDNVEKEEVKNIKAIHIEDEENLSKAIVDADIITTSVGANNLKSIGEKLRNYLKIRKANIDKPLNIMACENALFATNILKNSILEKGDKDFIEYVNQKIGFPNTAVDRIVPNVDIKKELPIDVAVEDFYEWDIEKKAIIGDLNIKGAELVDDLEPYIERKLFLLNGAHATTAYLGYLKGYKYIHEAIQDDFIRNIVSKMQEEASIALSKKHNIKIDNLREYSNKVIKRFKNSYLKDEVVRVGREPTRKLSGNDRLMMPAKLCYEIGITPKFILYGIAAGFLFDYKEDPQACKIQDDIKNFGLEKTISKITGLEENSDLLHEIVKKYKELKETFRKR
ncbi:MULTISPECIES: mannitol-1-phosphate 5-dehydrogenase [Thermoanaerobacter]|uniref:Mannitol-1-phosphate 5-dehydrogenase n=2 Tax=Thermoanaerobacter TaxID=1754 RepID=MTLD_THEP3|nr:MULTISPECIES: mannitol-1-phosphate 5-dehydrogenase [Thermoanaerobacter]B0KCW3.1 RecName: Full=Mannitol-1-phosphate 5-dehydrogenase [Thermoanaerobacter pseudethanolicus ATCC 33223]ABY95570.1 Mannitol dehydrogenase, C-terminal domain [Thermoanaerobacter pseudethanolicus ATCC 33223]ADV80505.1 Mannitol dehydrogenase domain protein [Thermoanaerobacter brockii subsp. finnii Ako-1]HBW60341.1 mannitol-1-phosphate 5-dehydrogenase [Thermoanaerobacter sp.]